MYFEIADTRDFLLEKYAELSDTEAQRIREKTSLDFILDEAEEMMKILAPYMGMRGSGTKTPVKNFAMK